MLLENITAMPHPGGNCIDLIWDISDSEVRGVRVVRREGRHPASPDDGVLVAEDEGLSFAADKNLKGETVYYYTLFPYKGDPAEYQFDRQNRVSAMATSPFNIAGQMYDLLPPIYHRYDTVLPDPDEVSEEDRQKGQLRRLLDIAGNHLDQFHSFARAGLDLHNLDKLDGSLLPLLAQWIGWKTDYNLEIETQRNEIKNAPALYKRIGIIPTVEATVKRMSGWESRTKEFVHNVFLSNRPERLNICLHQRSSAGEWTAPAEPLSLDFAYEGRPTAIHDGEGVIWLFYHTLRNGNWHIGYKKYMSIIDPGFEDELDSGAISPALIKAFKDEGFSLSQNSRIKKQASTWLIIDGDEKHTYTIKKEAGQVRIYDWTPGRFLTKGTGINKYPSALVYDSGIRLFWSSYDESNSAWSMKGLVRNGGLWTPIDTLPFGDDGINRKKPFAVEDDTGGFWLYWLERQGSLWEMKYSRYDGSAWGAEISFPLDGGQDPRVEGEPFILFHPAEGPARRFWVFWARQEAAGESDQTRWTLVYRVKENTNPDDTGWSGVQSLSALPPQYHDKEPAVFVNADGDIELFWSSNRNGSWSIRQRTLDVAANSWGTEEEITDTPYSRRAPFPLSVDDTLFLIYRSNESISYASDVYGATKTVDFRYAGSTTVHIRDAEKIALRGKFEDFQTYTYDTGKKETDWYSRDTIGLYLNNDTMDKGKIKAGIDRLEKVLAGFMPITDRAVFIPRQDLHTEYVYTYGLPLMDKSRFISESHKDVLTSLAEEALPGPGEGII
ncbi:MAG: phage tail protein [Deltaproteobacteria bacterium]|nr:phage tail protein [Deltaproteobacteria bacterium]